MVKFVSVWLQYFKTTPLITNVWVCHEFCGQTHETQRTHTNTIKSSAMASIMVIIMLNFYVGFVYQMQIERSNESVHTELSACQNWIEQTSESESRNEHVALRLGQTQSNNTTQEQYNEKWGENIAFTSPLQYTTFDFYVIYRLMRRRLAHLPQSEKATSIVYGDEYTYKHTEKERKTIYMQTTPNI